MFSSLERWNNGHCRFSFVQEGRMYRTHSAFFEWWCHKFGFGGLQPLEILNNHRWSQGGIRQRVEDRGCPRRHVTRDVEGVGTWWQGVWSYALWSLPSIQGSPPPSPLSLSPSCRTRLCLSGVTWSWPFLGVLDEQAWWSLFAVLPVLRCVYFWLRYHYLRLRIHFVCSCMHLSADRLYSTCLQISRILFISNFLWLIFVDISPFPLQFCLKIFALDHNSELLSWRIILLYFHDCIACHFSGVVVTYNLLDYYFLFSILLWSCTIAVSKSISLFLKECYTLPH